MTKNTGSASKVQTKYRSNLERTFNDYFKLPYEASRLKYIVNHTYCPDFTLGSNLFVETKGLFTSADRSKHLHIKQQHPHVKVLFVFQAPHLKLSKSSKTSYADWCNKHDFAWLHIDDVQLYTKQTLSLLLTK